jgi:PAS domain S-box-containing protein
MFQTQISSLHRKFSLLTGRVAQALEGRLRPAPAHPSSPGSFEQGNPCPGEGENAAYLQALIEAAPLGLHQYEALPDGRLIFRGANPAADRILGIEHRALIGLPIEQAFPAHCHTEIPAIYRRVALEGMPYSSDQYIYEDDQVQGAYEIHAFQAAPGRMAVFFQEISPRIKAAQALREREHQLEQYLQQMPMPITVIKPDGSVQLVNRAFLDLLGISDTADFLRTYNVFTDHVLIDGGHILPVRQAMQGEQVFVPEVEVKSKPTPTWVEMTLFPVLTADGEVWRVVSIWKDITERKKTQSDSERRMVELEALHAVALAGTEAVSAEDLLERVAGIVRLKLYPDHFGMAFLDEQNEALIYHPAFGHDNCWVAGRVPLNQGISGKVARTGVPQRLDDVLLEPDYLVGNPATRSELCVPILIAGRVIGVVNLENSQPASFSEADERLVTAIAGEIGTALEKIRLLEAERNRRKELETLSEISALVRKGDRSAEILPAVLNRIMSVLDLQGAAIFLGDDQTGDRLADLCSAKCTLASGQRLPASPEIARKVAETQHYYLENDLSAHPPEQPGEGSGGVKWLLCLALIVDRQTTGLLYLGRNTDFQPTDVHLTIAIADILANTLHRLKLNEQTEQQLASLMALRAIDQSILTSLDLEHTLEVLLEKITAILHADAANILLYDPHLQILKAAAQRGMPSSRWEEYLRLGESHAGKIALERQREVILDLTQIEDSLTAKIRDIGETFVSYIGIPLVAKDKLVGVIQLLNRSRLDPGHYWMGFLEAVADQAAIAIENAQLFHEQQQTNRRLTKAYEDTIDGWSKALDLRDKETEGHSQRVTDLTLELARRMGVSEPHLVQIRRGARLHDIGKMVVPDLILHKAGPLTQDEWEIMRQHPIIAVDLIYPIEFLSPALDIPYCHHEKWDGTGYPQQLKGKEIPLAARIFAIIDVWDALTSDRPYRKAWDKAQALEYIRQQSGLHFDPKVVEAFLGMIEEKGLS